MRISRLASLPRQRAAGKRPGIASICTAHPMVIEAVLRHGRETGSEVLIEATCNQVNQEGGYTGMTPADFRRFVEAIAARIGFDPGRLILGGDHLGPNPWKHLPAEQAMAKAEAMISAYSHAGFSKLHLDTSMGCAGETTALPDETIARRAARLALAADHAAGGEPPVYVVGTEVPVPGGAMEALDHLQPTRPEAAMHTVGVHRSAFAEAGAERAFERVIGVVVQPGVEFSHSDVAVYQRDEARELSAVLNAMPQFVFEAHSTDYQPPAALRALVEDGFAILKVGPWLTFALREALYGLDHIARAIDSNFEHSSLVGAMEKIMARQPQHWENYYHGSEDEKRVLRHFSYSDRIRYYWPEGQAQAAVGRLLACLGDRPLPATLISQFLAASFPEVAAGRLEPTPAALIDAAIRRVLDTYEQACGRSEAVA